jgi:hypothetical protein
MPISIERPSVADPALPPFSAASPEEMRRTLADIDISVPLRTEGRTTAHCERWSAARMLAAKADAGELSYPLSVESRDRPDLLLTLPDRKVGVEITEATPTDWARVDAMREHLDQDQALLIPQFLPNDPARSLDEIKTMAEGQAPTQGWAGNAPERQWADAMCHVIEQKIAKAGKPGFQHFDENWLLIYSAWPLPSVDLDVASSLLLERLQALSLPIPFQKILIEKGDQLITFSDGKYVRQPIPSWWPAA